MGHRRTDAARGPVAGALLGLGLGLLGGCTGPASGPAPDGGPGDPEGRVSVQAGDTVCEVSPTRAATGALVFTVTNTGATVTEFVLYDSTGRVIGAVDGIDPGRTGELAVAVPSGGAYTTACRPGQAGDGIRGPFTVTGSGAPTFDTEAALAAATVRYQRYLASQADALVRGTREFADAVRAGDVGRARTLYPVVRAPYERVEPLVRPLDGLAVRIDGQEDDERDPGAAWSGFHRLERDLWGDGLRPDSARVADRLVTDVETLRTRILALQPGPAEVGTTAKELLDQITISKISGAEDPYSRTDLADLAANVEGSRDAVAVLRPVIDQKDAPLGTLLDQRFAALEGLLAGYRTGTGYRSSATLTDTDRKKIIDAVDAVGEPVSTVGGVVTS